MKAEEQALSTAAPERPWPWLARLVPEHAGRIARAARLGRPLPFLLALGYLASPSAESRDTRHATDRKQALVSALASKDMHAEAGEIFFLDPPPSRFGVSSTKIRALVRARQKTEPADIWLTVSRFSPNDHLLELVGLYNLSDTSAVEERALTVDGTRAAWVIDTDGKAFTLKLADLSAESVPTGWPIVARLQNRITNLQETGQQSGVGIRTFRLDPPAERLELGFESGALGVQADDRAIRIPTAGGAIDGARFLEEQTPEKGRPGNLVTWAVDRVRALPWFGSDRMQLVKAVAFEILDWVERGVGSVTGDTGAERVKQELAGLGDAPLAPELPDPETGWPPAPMKPMLSPPLEGEGKWRPLEKDPFIQVNPGVPAPFVQSFVRTDPKRAYTQTWVLVWDPRQVALHTMSGTIEPKSATGETGPGLVPRKPEVMGRLVAGFNGGFQATHGEFGMMADGVVYLPPKPYAATVAELADGSTGFGTWPADDKVPENIVSFRQNMTPLVMDESVNPYKRNWWGGVPPGWTDESRTTRSGVCQTKEGFVAYLYGASIDADHLAEAMRRARCVYGIHLDMNPGHTGLEFYRAAPAGKLPELGRKLDAQWEAEGAVSGMEGWRFLGRRMLRYMGLMNFPRYVQRESRDFFYLTLRHVLPGENLASALTPAESGEGEWKTKGLPQHGFPYAIATSWVRPDASRPDDKLTVLELDPNMVELAKGKASEASIVLTLPPAGEGALSLWLGPDGARVAKEAPAAKWTALVRGAASPAADSVAGLGIDSAGMVIYAEASARGANGGALIEKLFEALGLKQRLYLSKPLALALGGDRDLGGRALPARADALVLSRRPAPGVTRIFPETPIVPVSTWYPLQAKRVRYFPKPKKAEPEVGGGTPSE